MKVLFLDEPTTGLDPQNRVNLWDQIRKLRDSGTTIFLTTHYLEEADELADRLSIMDHGKIVAEGTPYQLKQQIAGDVTVIRTKLDRAEIGEIMKILNKQTFIREVRVDGVNLHLYVEDGTKTMPRVFDVIEVNDLVIESLSLLHLSLDDVFLKETGRSLRYTGSDKEVLQ